MPVDDILNRIDSHLKGIKRIEPAKRAATVDDLIQIRRWLDDSASQCSAEELLRLESLRKAYSDLALPVANDLQQVCTRQLEQYEAGKRPVDLEQFGRDLGQVSGRLEAISELFPEHRSDDGLQKLREKLDTLSRKQRSAQRLKRLQDETHQLWQRADQQETERGSIGRAIDLCKEAKNKLLGELNGSAEWEDIDRDQLFILSGQANERYDDIRGRHEIMPTREAGEQWIVVIPELVTLVAENPSKLVTYFAHADLGAELQPMEASKALDIARARMVNLFWSVKVQKYIDDAGQKLDMHKPREALADLRQWEKLAGLNDARLGVSFPPDLRVNISNAEERIKPELNAWEAASKAIEKARKQSDPLKAYKDWSEAQVYPYFEGSDDCWQWIIQKARTEVNRLCKEAETQLKKEEWGLCEIRLTRIEELLSIDSDLRAEIQDRVAPLKQIYEQVRPLTSVSGRRMGLEDELQLLQDLQDTYRGSYWQSWIKLQQRIAELGARSSVQALQDEVNRRCKPDVAIETLDSLRHDCERMKLNPPEHMSQEDVADLTRLLTKLNAWIGFAQARDELAKSKPSNEAGQDSGWADPPDLEKVRQGIEATREDPQAAHAIRDKGLSQALALLEKNDVQAEQAVIEAGVQLATPSLNSAREALNKINSWLGQPTSYRAQFLRLRRQAQSVLMQQIEKEIRTRLDRGRGKWYEGLDVTGIENLLKESNSLPTSLIGGQQDRPLAKLTEVPLSIARAASQHKAAEQGNASWETVQRSWEATAEKATEDRLQEYCIRRSRQAYKQFEIGRARLATSHEESATIIQALCSDALLRDDSEVWFIHGKFCLEAAQQLLSDHPAQVEQAAERLLRQARESLNRARAIAMAGATASGEVERIDKVLSDLSGWEKLVRAAQAIKLALGASGDRLGATVCEEAQAHYSATFQSPTSSEPARLLGIFWKNERGCAKDRLEAQAGQTTDVLERLDAWLGISILFPEDTGAKNRLAKFADEGYRDVSNKVNSATFDPTAKRFLEQYAKQHDGKAPESREVARLQLEQTQGLMRDVDNLKAVLRMVSGKVAWSGVSPDALDQLEETLNDWEKQLQAFQRALNQAANLANVGLRVPEQFDVANYVLGRGTKGLPGYVQVPSTFKDNAHPSYLWCQEEVKALSIKRNKQEAHKRRIELLLKYEQVARYDELPRQVQDTEEQQVLGDLRNKLQSMSSRSYPIEEALNAVRQMQEEEPDDPCGLQEAMVYADPDENGRRYESLPIILDLLDKKVKQIHTVRDWLGQFTPGRRMAYRKCPGVVDWGVEKNKIIRLRDSGPNGLGEASRRCRQILVGGEDGMYEGLWSLTKARDALSREEMFKQLKGDTESGDDDQDVVLCAVAGNIDREREHQYNEFSKQIEECQNLAGDIRRRIDNYEPAWDAVINAYGKLMKITKEWRKRREWQEFVASADRFAGVCPNYNEFQSILDDVHNKTFAEFKYRKDRSQPSQV